MERVKEKRTLSTYVEPEMAESIENEARRSRVSTSAILRQIVDEYLRERPILRLIEARRRDLITHEECVDKFAILVERDGGDGSEE